MCFTISMFQACAVSVKLPSDTYTFNICDAKPFHEAGCVLLSDFDSECIVKEGSTIFTHR